MSVRTRGRTQVIVVGAGPVGLLTALGLAQRGIEVTVLDAAAAVSRAPRAIVYFHTTLEVLQNLGLLQEAQALGLRNTRFDMRYPASGEVLRIEREGRLEPGQVIDHNLHLGQHLLADLVLRHLARARHAGVRWNHEVVGLAQDEHGVTLQVRTPRGVQDLSAAWVIGADGAHSAVRRLAGLAFDGHTWPERFVATNIEYDFAAHGFADANMIVDPCNWAVVARTGRGQLWRVTYGEDAALDEASVRERLPQRLAAILPDDAPWRLDSFSPYRVHERCAPTFRARRVLLAGDAAHVCNPCGGMGLTSGVLDAEALVRVLSAVIAGSAATEVLDFYATERRRVFLEIASPMAGHFKRQLAEADPVRAAADRQAFIDSMDYSKPAARAWSLSMRLRGQPMPV